MTKKTTDKEVKMRMESQNNERERGVALEIEISIKAKRNGNIRHIIFFSYVLSNLFFDY